MEPIRAYEREKTCYCHTCERAFHPLGIARHRAKHRDRKELCVISLTFSGPFRYDYRPPDQRTK